MLVKIQESILAVSGVVFLAKLGNWVIELMGQASPKTSFYPKLEEQCSSPTYFSHSVNKHKFLVYAVHFTSSLIMAI